MTHKPFSTEKVLAVPLLSKLKCTPVCLSRLFSHYYSIFFCIKTFRCMVKRQTSRVHYNCSLLVLLYIFFLVVVVFLFVAIYRRRSRKKYCQWLHLCISWCQTNSSCFIVHRFRGRIGPAPPIRR